MKNNEGIGAKSAGFAISLLGFKLFINPPVRPDSCTAYEFVNYLKLLDADSIFRTRMIPVGMNAEQKLNSGFL